MSMLRLSLTTALVLCTPFYAQAAVDAAGAAALTTRLNESIKSMSPLVPSGDVVVKPDGDAYAVTLPTLESKGDDANFVFAPITMRMTPVSETTYKYNATLANPFMTLTDTKGAPRGQATVASHQITGEWDIAKNLHNNSVTVLKGVVLNDTKDNFTIKLAEIGAVSQITATTETHGTIQGSLNLRGLEFTHADTAKGEGMRIKLEALGVESLNKNYDLAAYSKLQDIDIPHDATQQQALSGLGAILNTAVKASAQGTGNVAVTLNNLSATYIEKAGERPTTFSLPLLKLALDGSDTPEGMASASLNYEHSGLSMSPAPSQLVADLLPASAKLNMAFSNLPAVSIMDKLSSAIAVPDATNNANVHKAATDMMDIATKAGTTLTINNVDFTSKALSATTQGSIKITNTSPANAVGSLNSRLTGVKELAQRLTEAQAAQKPTTNGAQPQQDPTEGAVMFGLSMVQMFGKEVPEAKPSAYTYAFELTNAGILTLNGNPMMTFAPHQPKPAAAGEGTAVEPAPTAAPRKGNRPAQEALPDLKP